MLPFQEADANICKYSLRIFSSSQDGTGAPGGAAGGPGAPPAANEDLVAESPKEAILVLLSAKRAN